MGSSPVAVTASSDIAPVWSKEFLDIQITSGYRFTLTCVCDMIKTRNRLQTFEKNLRRKRSWWRSLLGSVNTQGIKHKLQCRLFLKIFWNSRVAAYQQTTRGRLLKPLKTFFSSIWNVIYLFTYYICWIFLTLRMLNFVISVFLNLLD